MLAIDKKLRYPERCLRLQSGALLFGPTGDRLFAETLSKKPGFVGKINFIHTLNISRLFEVRCVSANGDRPDFDLAQTVWHPSHMTFSYRDEDVWVEESKFITKNDTAVSCMTWENLGDVPLTLSLDTSAEQCRSFLYHDCPALETPVTYYGFRVGVVVRTENVFPCTLLPGEKLDVVIAACAVNLETETPEAAYDIAGAWLGDGEAVFEKHLQEYGAFFEAAPHFECSDDILNTVWDYRWFILRHCMSNPRYGNLSHVTEYEGRSHKVSKLPFDRNGWEFTKLIPLSTPLHVTELRWHHDAETAHDIARGFFSTADENGIARWSYVHEYGTSYSNFMVWAVYRMYLLDGDLAFVREMLPAMKRFVDGHIKVYGNERDRLQIEYNHDRTGKEYQPSYWYFHRDEDGSYPKNPWDMSRYTPLKRVDRSVYHLLNVMGVSRLCALCGEEEAAAQYGKIAEELRKDILEKMWDPTTGFFYDLHYQTDEKAMVKNIVGVYPYWAEITDETQLRGMNYLFDPEHFAVGSAFASVSKECGAYRPEGGWLGTFIKGRNGCVWCGPSWPYTTCITLDAIARQSKAHNHCFDDEFKTYLRQYCFEHFRDNDPHKPYLVEHYNAETGEHLSDDVDYNHSYFAELVISHLCGIEVKEDRIVIDPVDIGLRYWKLDNITVRGHQLRLIYSKGKARPEKGLPAGLHIFVDDREVFAADGLAKTILEF